MTRGHLVSLFALALACLNALLCTSQSSGIFIPGQVPLGIRSPYLNAWSNGVGSMRMWPTSYNLGFGWSGYARIDGLTWEWLGDGAIPLNISKFTNLEITPTRTTYTLEAGGMSLTLTYMTPIEPADLAKQSIPFIYYTIEANSTDGQPHSVQLYSDISAEWVSGNRSEVVKWSTTNTGSTTYHTVQLQQPTAFAEINDLAEDQSIYFAMGNKPGLTARIGTDNDCRSQFASIGSLSGNPASPSGIIDSPYEVFSLAMDLGNITSTQEPVVWALGSIRNPDISYKGASGQLQSRVPYFLVEHSTVQDAIDVFVSDYSSASQRATDLDNRILKDASVISPQYANLVSLAARQTIGSSELSIVNGTDGHWNTSDVKMFMKDIGTSRRVNPVEILYTSFPFFLYLNASYGGQLLSPLLEFQDSPQWTQPYAARDLGSAYPQAVGNNNPHGQGVEQSGNMLIMCLAQARASGDGTLIDVHYDLLKGWANYLVNNTLAPTKQTNADSEQQANNTNLAIKGIIGIKAMAEISQTLGRSEDAQYFASMASAYSSTWESLALSSDDQHVLSSYGDPTASWSLVYNLYADKLLQTNVVGDNVYQAATSYYKKLLSSSISSKFGLPLDSTSLTQTNAAWTLFTAATVSDSTVRDALIGPVWTRANMSSLFPPVYKLDSTSATVTGVSSPAMGAVFSLLALNVANKTITVPPRHVDTSTTKKSIVGPVVGGVIGGLAIIGVGLLGIYLWRHRARHQFPAPIKLDMRKAGIDDPLTVPFEYNPYSEPQHLELAPLGLPQPSDSSLTLAGPTGNEGIILSSKAREALGYQSYRTLPSIPFSTGGASSSAPASSREPPTEVSISPSQVEGLRAEVENLRRAMQEIQAERMESPPGYHDVQSQSSSSDQPYNLSHT